MSPLPAFIFSKVRLGLYDFVYPGSILPNEGRIEAEHHILERNSTNRHLIEEVQSEWLCAARFDRGELCFIALHQGEIVSYIWGSRGKVGVEEIAMSIQTAPLEMYLYDAVTLEPWRGNNLYPAVLKHALEYGRDLGLERITIFVEARNIPSIRGVTKAGFILFQTLLYKSVFGFGKRELLPPMDGHPPANFVRI